VRLLELDPLVALNIQCILGSIGLRVQAWFSRGIELNLPDQGYFEKNVKMENGEFSI
jgi:hypothetical protein